MKRNQLVAIAVVALLVVLGGTAAASDAGNASNQGGEVRVKITVGGEVFTATLNEGETARDFVSLLPLTLDLEDHAGKEKIAYLPRKLSTEGAPDGTDPSVGDITYFAPWGNIAMFYGDMGHANGLIPLGEIEGEMDVLAETEASKVTFEVLDNEKDNSEESE